MVGLIFTLPFRLSFFFLFPVALIKSSISPGASGEACWLFTPLPESASWPGLGTLTSTVAVPFFLLRVTAPRVNKFEGETTADTFRLRLGEPGTNAADWPSARFDAAAVDI